MAANETNERTDQAVASAQVHFVIASIAVVGLLLALGATVGFGLRSGLGVLVGATLATLNMWSLKRIGAGFFSEAGSRRRLWGVAGALKFVVLAGVVVALLALHLVQPIAFVIGYGALPIGITLGSLLGPRAAEESVH
ncbi:MAG: hypothetical protein HY898_35505 [Deltaproteobacteria bacterium]|nr:hypothetical protein [Deltaproteobacteria bacterium]